MSEETKAPEPPLPSYITAIVPAAGLGRRMSPVAPFSKEAAPAGVKKTSIELMGKPILSHTLEALSASPLINSIILLVAPGDVEIIRDSVVLPYSLDKVTKVLEGGAERQDSVAIGLKAMTEETEMVLIHDGARPFVTTTVIEGVIKGALECGGAVAGVAINDTVKVVEDDIITGGTPRELLRSIQTPQCFLKEILVEAHRVAALEGLCGTDESSLVQHIGGTVKVTPGDFENIKITTPSDLIIGRGILEGRGCKS